MMELTKREMLALEFTKSLMISLKNMDVKQTPENYIATGFYFADKFIEQAGK